MRSIHLAILAGGLILGSARLSCVAAIYYTATTGSDTAPGDATAPFRTIRRGLEALHPSDVLIVQHGNHDERVCTVRGVASHTARITIQSDGPVRLKGWIVNHSNITIRGFRVSGHSAPSLIEANVVANRGDKFLQLLDLVRFDARTTNVIGLTEGLLHAGIEPGMPVFSVQAQIHPDLSAPTSAPTGFSSSLRPPWFSRTVSSIRVCFLST